MRIYKIQIEEKITKKGIEIFSEEVKVQCYKELSYSGDHFITNEYQRNNKGKPLRIGVKVLHAAKVIIKNGSIEKKLYKSNVESDLWYDKANVWLENNFEERTETIFGWNACGRWTIKAYAENGKILGSEVLWVIPSLLTISQYQTMQTEVKSMFEQLAFDQSNAGEEIEKIKETQLPLFPLEKLEKSWMELQIWLARILETPGENLIRIDVKKPLQQIKRWDGRTLREHALFPERERLGVRETSVSNNLPEHRMIQDSLESILRTIKEHLEVENSSWSNLKKEHDKRKVILNYETGLIKNKMEQRLHAIELDIKLLETRQEKWKKILLEIQFVLQEELFQGLPIDLDETHLFVHDPAYSSVFELIMDVNELSVQLKKRELAFILDTINSPHLYEVWVLLQLIHQLKRLKFDCSLLWDSLLNKYYKDSSLSGWYSKLSSSEIEGEVLICYEKELEGNNQRKLKPDFLLYYRKNNSEEWKGHSIDAKYKPYSDMEENQLRRDLNHSVVRYENQLNAIKAGALVHMDSRITNWNVGSDSPYKVSHFSMIPGDLGNLNTFVTMFLHYYCEIENCCPTCGNKTEPNGRAESYKTIYICDHDQEVWVRNTCKREFHPTGTLKRLMKYSSQNYNYQVDNDWNVHCPECSRDYHGNYLGLNLFGERV